MPSLLKWCHSACSQVYVHLQRLEVLGPAIPYCCHSVCLTLQRLSGAGILHLGGAWCGGHSVDVGCGGESDFICNTGKALGLL